MDINTTFTNISNTVNLFNTRFLKGVNVRQDEMWKVILNTIKTLETDSSGNILSNINNLKTLRTLRGSLSNIIISVEYEADVSKYLTGFEEIKNINDKYYQTITSGLFNANKYIYNEIKNYAIEATSNSLLDAGITENVIKPVESILNQSVTVGGNFSDLTNILRNEILGNDQIDGKLTRYSKQITTDALNQFNANYNQTISNDIGLEFYYYNGAVKETTRDYCKGMISGGVLGLPGGRYFHKKEIEESASKQWAGKIPSTTASNILTYRGGYNCGHQWLAVDSIAVPQSVKDRAIEKGYIKE